MATVLALAVVLPADASIPPLETRPSLAALAAQATAEPPAPAAADAATDAPFRLFKADHHSLAGAAQGRFHLFPEAKTRVRGIDLEIAPRIELRRFQVPERTGFALFGGGESRRRARILYYAKARYYDPEVGLFLTEDPFQGEVDTPPSLHRYLYAYQNPTVWVDPTGQIAVLQALKDKIAEGKEAILDLADRLDDNRSEQNVLQREVAEELAEKAGVAAGLAGIAELVRSARGTVVAAAQGDSRAKAEVIAFATEVAVDIAIGGKGVGQVAKGGRRVAGAVGETVDIAGEFVVRRGGGQVGRSGRALFEELPAGGRAGDSLGSKLRGGAARRVQFDAGVNRFRDLDTGRFVSAQEAVTNPVPQRVARVFDADLLGRAQRLGAPAADDVFVTNVRDLAGLTTSDEIARRLTLLDHKGNIRRGPLAIIEFDTPSGIATPVLRSDPGFVGYGRTAGGATEFVIPNYRIEDMVSISTRLAP